MATTVADVMVATLRASGVRRVYGIPGDSLNGFTDALRREDALREAFGHDGPALVEVATARQELSLPPHLSYGQIKGFTLYATRTILSGGGSELIELARTNLRDLEIE